MEPFDLHGLKTYELAATGLVFAACLTLAFLLSRLIWLQIRN